MERKRQWDLALSFAEFSNKKSKQELFSIVNTKVPTHVVELVKLPSRGTQNQHCPLLITTIDHSKKFSVLEAQNQKYKQLAGCKRRLKSSYEGDKVTVHLTKERLASVVFRHGMK